jgi:hypothetical protein
MVIFPVADAVYGRSDEGAHVVQDERRINVCMDIVTVEGIVPLVQREEVILEGLGIE